MNGALDEAMEIMKGSLADNSEIEQPYRTSGKIFLDGEGQISSIYVRDIFVDFEIIYPIDNTTKTCYSRHQLEDMGWEYQISKDGLEEWIMTDRLSSEEWSDLKQNYFDF